MASKVLLLLAALAAVAMVTVDARWLLAPTGDVKSETTINTDINGGVPPLEKRIKAAQKLWAPREQLLLVEAECKKNKDTECKKLKALKTKLEEDKEKAEEKEEVKAPCKQNVLVTYFLGTVCLPEKPFDVKPKDKPNGKKSSEKKGKE